MSIGIKMSQPGYNVKTSPDDKMAFSSEWQTLRIIKEVPFRIPASSVATTIFFHDLGYAPLYWPIIDKPGDSNLALIYPDGTAHVQNSDDLDIVVDEHTIRYITTSPSGGEVTGRVILFENPLVQNYEAPIDLRGSGDAIDTSNYGVRFVNNGSIDSTDKRDFAIDSTSRTPLVHRIKNGTTDSTKQIIINHDLGQLPAFFVYAKLSGADYWQFVTNATDAFISSTDTDTTVQLFATCEYVVWVLKEPVNKV